MYQVQKKGTEELYACKIVDMSHDGYETDEVETEIRLGQLVSGHPNVVNIVDVFRDERYWYLVQQLVTGGELFEIVIRRSQAHEAVSGDARPYSEREASLVLRQIVAAVAHCHSKGVVHRDLKPENILCSSSDADAMLKLADFGLSAEIQSGQKLTSSSGTPEYVAPEVVTRPPVCLLYTSPSPRD